MRPGCPSISKPSWPPPSTSKRRSCRPGRSLAVPNDPPSCVPGRVYEAAGQSLQPSAHRVEGRASRPRHERSPACRGLKALASQPLQTWQASTNYISLGPRLGLWTGLRFNQLQPELRRSWHREVGAFSASQDERGASESPAPCARAPPLVPRCCCVCSVATWLPLICPSQATHRPLALQPVRFTSRTSMDLGKLSRKALVWGS